MTHTVGFKPATATEGDAWDSTFDGGNRCITYLPQSSTPHTAITPLPSGQVLQELHMATSVAAGRDTTIPVGIYEFVGATTVNLLWSGELPMRAVDGTGWRFCSLTSLGVDASAWSGKRLGVARSRARDAGGTPIRYSGSAPSGRYDSGIGTAYDLPNPWAGTGTANRESLWAVFEDAPSGTTINAAPEALSITTPQATVQAGIDTNISAGAEALAVSGQAAQAASDRAINAQAEQLGISSQAALVSLQADIPASAEQISLSGNVARISSDRAISAQLGQITLATPGAVVTLLAEILAGTEQIGISGQQADIAIGIHAQAESITLLGLVSAITADRTLSATVESISVSPAPATVTLGAAIPAATEVLRLDTLPSSVRLDVAVHSSVLAIALSELSATIGLARHLDAEVASLTITPQGAEIELASGVQAQVASLTLEAFAATIEAAAPGNLPPGLQFTLPENRLAFSLPVNRIHFSFRRS